MDDYSINSLQESRNEWCARLVNILTPLVIEGFKSIFDESWKLCEENDEADKYLMTFQNLISRVPKWNTAIIDEEKKRIIDKSSCTYLEDLVTCVHIIQLKSLTCMRVGQKQKKIDISVPSLDDFIHKVYIGVARKLYTNVYLFEKGIMPLQVQKHNRELEIIVKECIVNAIRDNIPVENILRNYMDETVEEDVQVEEKEEIVAQEPVIESKDVVSQEQGSQVEADRIKEVIDKADSLDGNAAVDSSNKAVKTEDSGGIEVEKKSGFMINKEVSATPSSPKNEVIAQDTKGVSFSSVDRAIDVNNNEELVTAPKTESVLEEISEMRHEQRKLEEEAEADEDVEEDSLTIGDSINLDEMTVQDLNTKHKVNPDPVLTDIEVLS